MMAASLAVPAESMRLPDRGPGQEIITEMAWHRRGGRVLALRAASRRGPA